MVATKEVKEDLMTAENKGRESTKQFVQEADVEFFISIEKRKLKTFSKLKEIVKNEVNTVILIKSHGNMIGQLVLLMKTRKSYLREVFEYQVGPYPWSLCEPMGELRKTCKTSLFFML
jgi:hypothetical protein